MATKAKAVKTIHFTDHGQDFLEWDIDAKGKVIASRPFQEWVWAGCVITNVKDLRKGATVAYRRGKHHHTIQYPIASYRKPTAA